MPWHCLTGAKYIGLLDGNGWVAGGCWDDDITSDYEWQIAGTWTIYFASLVLGLVV